jgi:hypothetical protein
MSGRSPENNCGDPTTTGTPSTQLPHECAFYCSYIGPGADITNAAGSSALVTGVIGGVIGGVLLLIVVVLLLCCLVVCMRRRTGKIGMHALLRVQAHSTHAL